MDRFHRQLKATASSFRELVDQIPLQRSPPLPPEWLRCEMLERYLVLQQAGASRGAVLEVGCGSHAITTVPLAYLAGPDSRIVATDRERWSWFRAIVTASTMADRIQGVACDAGRLPFRDDAVDLALVVHGVRSLRTEDNMLGIFGEMLRAAPRIVVAETLPIARTPAQRAHLAMYDLREEVFRATTGRPDDLHYLSVSHLTSLIERAGGVVQETRVLDIDLPHFLAFFPRAMAESVPDSMTREILCRRWDEAQAMRLQFGEDHPPVGLIVASRSRSD